MKVYELINLLKKMPQNSEVKTIDGKYVSDPVTVEYQEGRDYVVIRPDFDF